MDAIWIVLIITIGVIVVVWMLRDRITRLFFKSPYGEGGMDADSPQHRNMRRRSPSTRVSGNRMIGKRNKIRVTQSDVDVQRNLMEGEELELNVDESDAQSPNQE
ncbi:hypothetical protein [Vacuolonema iberomarrocanum]|uniref:hypothetical protein n=1 Tax=Vacuolonema iberomarrocanum TaxID=3454632 RepID=UPI0019F453EC|nr:hypothetical protein [filamentous cyanobacterium LEGE 07170]